MGNIQNVGIDLTAVFRGGTTLVLTLTILLYYFALLIFKGNYLIIFDFLKLKINSLNNTDAGNEIK